MENVAYILGAGFSAPLGIPVMRDFLIKSKDLYFSDRNNYKHFVSVFNVIEKLSNIKNYYDADLFNIEEILSIIEMGNFLEGKKLKNDFIRYISDVISRYTPALMPYEQSLPSNWYDIVFVKDKLHSFYGYFVANLFNIQFEEQRITEHGQKIIKILTSHCAIKHANYAIITLNYDLVLENICVFIDKQYKNQEPISFNREVDPGNWNQPPLSKLHGSVDLDVIIPPTWAKGTTPKITATWKNAYRILQDSNHIRFIGYSLPNADAYIKYLIKSAVVQTKHLKSIDVICLDSDGSVKRRYDEFIKFTYYRFANMDTSVYLKELYDSTKNFRTSMVSRNLFQMNQLEQVHESFMRNHS